MLPFYALSVALLGYLCICCSDAVPCTGTESWGYTTVRPEAHLFWWLYKAQDYENYPLILWLQGGPGASGCGFGNFGEIGPFDVDLKYRDTTWLQAASLLFVDNPVGTGYSYVTNKKALTTNVEELSADMITLLQIFFKTNPHFQTLPFYIFSESYGGKMASTITLELHKALDAKSIECNFKGVALGDSWISPLDSVLTWGPYLFGISLLDKHGLSEVMAAANEVKSAYEKGQFAKSTALWDNTQNVVEKFTYGVDFYNIMLNEDPAVAVHSKLEHNDDPLSRLSRRILKRFHEDKLDALMNGPIRKKLGIIPKNVTWGGQSDDVFQYMCVDFMKPVISTVDALLGLGIDVTIYNAQLDLIVDTPGQELWIEKLKWPGLEKFNNLTWTPMLTAQSKLAAFVKTYQNLAFYWIMNAGHMVPSDQGVTALEMVKRVTKQKASASLIAVYFVLYKSSTHSTFQ
uniref:Carboxypeptidase n=2 Tax=Eptatretus burgeri TaxID=7764 RepID=A0A8C4NCQ5_EPTBU